MRVAAALVVAAVVAGCGGPSAADTFAKQGNAICRETKQTAGGRAGLVRLQALDPPPELRAERDRFFADLAALARLAPVTTPTERAKAAELMNRLPGEARALGWTDCVG